MLNFSDSWRPVFRGSSAPQRWELNSKGEWKPIVYTLLWRRQYRWVGSSHDHLRQSAQYLRSSSGHVRRAGLQNLLLFRTYRWTCCLLHRTLQRHWWFQHNCRLRTNHLGPMTMCREICCNITSKNSEIFQIIFNSSNVGITKTVAKETVFHDPRRDTKVGPVLEVAVSHHQGRYGIEIMLVMELVHGWWLWVEYTNTWRKWLRKPKTTTSITLENVQGNLWLKQDRNKPQWRQLLLQRQRCHIICVCGLSWNQIRTTRVVSKCQKRWSDCFDTILQYFEKKTEQSNSESWHRCFVQNFRLLKIGHFEHGWITCKKEEDLKIYSSIVWVHSLLIPSYTLEQFKATLEENKSILHCKTSPSTAITLEAPGGSDVKKGKH